MLQFLFCISGFKSQNSKMSFMKNKMYLFIYFLSFTIDQNSVLLDCMIHSFISSPAQHIWGKKWEDFRNQAACGGCAGGNTVKNDCIF